MIDKAKGEISLHKRAALYYFYAQIQVSDFVPAEQSEVPNCLASPVLVILIISSLEKIHICSPSLPFYSSCLSSSCSE